MENNVGSVQLSTIVRLIKVLVETADGVRDVTFNRTNHYNCTSRFSVLSSRIFTITYYSNKENKYIYYGLIK